MSMSITQKELDDHAAKEQAEIDKRRDEYLDSEGYRTFVKWPEGSTPFTLERALPRDFVNNWGTPKKVFQIQIEGEEFDWGVTATSPMYEQINAVVPKTPIDGVLTRVGMKSNNTRYSLVWVGEEP